MGASLATPTHLVILLVVCLLLFGAKRLPEIGHSLGSGLREFKMTVTGSDGVVGGEATSEIQHALSASEIAPVLAEHGGPTAAQES